MKNFILPIFLLLLFIKSSISEGLTKKDLVKMSPQQIFNTARNGDAIAQLWLGDAIYKGTFPNWNKFEPCEWYYKSALQNNAEAAFKLHEGIPRAKSLKVCQYIDGVGKTNLDSNYWLYKSARLNYGPAQYRLFLKSKNKKNKLKWIEKAVESKDVEATIRFGKMHLDEYLVKKNVKKAIALFEKASIEETKNGVPINIMGEKDTPADYELAMLYSNDLYLQFIARNSEKNLQKKYDYSNFFNMEKAVSSAKKCVEKKVSYVCYMSLIHFHSLTMYENIDYDEALFWLEEAEGILKNDRYYFSILTAKGIAILNWPNLKIDKIKAREYFNKAIIKGKGIMSRSSQKFNEKMLQQTY